MIVDVRRALRRQLLTLATLPPVAWEGRPYAPQIDVMYVREHLIPTGSVPISIPTPTSLTRNTALYQLDVFVPTSAQLSTGDTVADALTSLYRTGQILVEATQPVRIRSTQRAGAIQKADWRMIPVTITVVFDTTT